MLIRRTTTAGGERYRVLNFGVVFVGPMGPVLFFGLLLGLLREGRTPALGLAFVALIALLFLWILFALLNQGLEFRDDQVILHSLTAKTVIFRDELVTATCWYDFNIGVQCEFAPTRFLPTGKTRRERTSANLALSALITPKDIRRLAVLIQKWWQTGPTAPTLNGDPVTRVVRTSGLGKSRDEVLDEFPEWWVLYAAVEPKAQLKSWADRPG